MNTYRTFLIAALTILQVVPGGEMETQSLEMNLARLTTSQTDTAKANAFSDLLNRGRKEGFSICAPVGSIQIRQALITALEKENVVVHSEAAPLSETETEYYANIIGCVAALRDPTALRGLLGAIETGGGAIDGVVALGDAAVPGLLQLLDGPGSRGRVAAVMAVGKLAAHNGAPQPRISSGRVSPANLAAIRVRLLKALERKDRFVRLAAVQSLTCYADPELRRAMETLATSDSATIDMANGTKDYPVRRAAQAWLKQDSR
jgi:HEAT repeat protein